MRNMTVGWALLLVSCGASLEPRAVDTSLSSDELAALAVDPDESIAEPAIAELRARGRTGFEAIFAVHADAIERLRSSGRAEEGTPRLRHAIDLVAAQRDAHASGLYWHTDMTQAQEEARERGLPILSLRLLGQLDEELSCANSRLFRVLLYSDPRVASELRQHFVLHWSSERPAPRVTIDMGDGRVIERTLTGNSVHYVFDAEGRPVDAIVGLYSPVGFLQRLADAREIAALCVDDRNAPPEMCRGSMHGTQLARNRRAWRSLPGVLLYERARSTLPGMETPAPQNVAAVRVAARGNAGPNNVAPPAMNAMRLTVSKMAVEMPVLEALTGEREPANTEPDWESIARGLEQMDAMHPNTLALLRLKGARGDVTEVAETLRLRAAADGARNELLFHHRVHELFRERGAPLSSFEALNRWVYTELMLTPADDPWLGLDGDGLASGIETP